MSKRQPTEYQSIGCTIPGCGCLFWALAIVGALYLLGLLT